MDRGKPLPKMSLDDYLPYEDENVMEKSWMILRIGLAILAQIVNERPSGVMLDRKSMINSAPLHLCSCP